MPPSEISTPPPLPHTLSSRLRSTIDPTTGCCKHHPSVQLCELVQGGSRWVVRRKICYKCGSRPQAGGGRHKPGVSVTNPGLSSRARDLEKSIEKGSGREGRERRSRSVSVDRLGSSSRGMDRADRKERHRSESNDRHGSSRRRSQSAARRGSSSAALLTGGPLDKAASNPLAASSHRLESAGRGRRSSRELDREKSSSRRASRSKSNDGMESALKELQSQRKEARGRSRSNDALEEAGKRERSHRDHGGNKDHHGAEHKSNGRNRGSSSSLHSRALEFTQLALEDVAVATPLQDHHEPKALADHPHTHHHDIQTPNHHHHDANPGAIIQSCPPQLQETPIAEDFNESDPIIMIPTLALVPGLPPPPPRTSDEMLRHQERLEMRRRSIRREREERRKRRARERKEEEEGKNKERTKSGGENGRDKAKGRRNFSANDVVAEAREAPEEPVAPMPSAAALALLDEYDPKETKEEKKHPTRLDRAKSESHDSEPEPSPAAVALLDANLKRKSERKLANDRRRSSRHQHKKRSHSHDDALTLTSELSFGTAKMYAPPTSSNNRRGGFSGDHHVRMHPELEGVALPDGPMPSQSTPPMDITVDRSRSLSRSRSARASEDPPSQGRKARDPDSGGRRASETNKRGVSRGASRRASSQALVTRESKHERRESNSRALVQAIDAAEKHEGGRKASVKDSSAKARRRSSSRPSRGDDFHKSAPALAASSARSARRGSSKGRVWDATGHEVEAKNNRAPSRSVERKERSSGTDARSSRHVDARSYSPSRESRAVKSEGGARRNKGSDKASKHRGGHKHHSASSKDGRSRLTSSTHPESHSSEEMARHNSHDEYHASPRPRYEEIEEEEPEPVMIYKKRASSKRLQLQHEDDTTDVGYDKPIGAISFHSGDERSHTSSISSSSTIDDESTVEHDEDEEEEHRRGRARERALHALHGVKGGARKLGTRSRSALGGLKDTRRKWQSALFM